MLKVVDKIKLGLISPLSKFNLLNSKDRIVQCLSFNKLQRRSNIEQNYIRARQAYCNIQQHGMIHINIFFLYYYWYKLLKNREFYT